MEQISVPEKITSLSQLDMNGFYTYLDYLSWKFEQRVELIKGKIFPMSAPTKKHQIVSRRFTGVFYNLFENKGCEYFAAPFDVRLYDNQKPLKQNKNFNTVVQPDLCIVCDSSKLDDKGCFGAPDLMVEILSPGNSTKEMQTKKRLYEENGIKEYWVVDFDREQVIQFVLNDVGVYTLPTIFVSNEILESFLFPELKINLVELFA